MKRWLLPLTASFGVIVVAAACSTQPAPTATSAPTATPVRAASPTAASPTAAPQSTAKAETKEVMLLRAARAPVVATVAALEKGDIAAARTAWEPYNYVWNGMEVYVNYRSLPAYQDIELNWEAKITTALASKDAKAADVLPMAKAMLAKWDETLNMVISSPPISPLFDDLADIRAARQPLRKMPTALAGNDIAMAKSQFAEFTAGWPKAGALIKLRSQAAFDETEAAAKAVSDAFAKPSSTAAEITPLVATLTSRFGYGQNLVNSAARKADLTKTTFAQDDVNGAGGIRGLESNLKASLAAWESGNYTEAKAQADKANTLFAAASVSGPLKAKALDAALKTPLDTYAALAGAAGDAAKVRAANKTAIEAGEIAIQGLVGQFWTDPKLAPAIVAAMPK